jgi:tight adherence protein B
MGFLVLAIAVGAAAGVGIAVYGVLRGQRPVVGVEAAAPSAPEPRESTGTLGDVRERLRRQLEPAISGVGGMERTRRLVADLASANWKLRPYEFRLIQGGVALALAVIGLLRFGFGLPALVMAVAGWVLPAIYLRNRRGARLRSFDAELPRAMELIANAVKGGQSVAQALHGVAENSGDPIAEEFRIAAREVELGASVDHALDNMVRRLGSDDLRLVVMVIGIQHAIGGNLPAILTTLADTMRQRDEMREEVLSATAQSRASSVIITLLPIVAALFLFFVTPGYFTPMLTNPVGWVLLGIALGLLVVGNIITRQMTRIA